MLWPDEKSGPWAVTVWWRVQHGVPTPVGLAMTSWSEPINDLDLVSGDADIAFPILDGQTLRGLSMTKILDATRRQMRERLAEPISDAQREEAAWVRRRLAELGQEDWADMFRKSTESREERAEAFTRRAGTRDLGDVHYRQVAEVYAQAVRDGAPPTKAVAKWLAGPAAPAIADGLKSTAAKQVARARERGFLPKHPGQGRIGPIEEQP